MKPSTSISTYTITDHSHMETNVESVYHNGRTYQLIFRDVCDGVMAMTITGKNVKTSSLVSCTQAITHLAILKLNVLFLLKTAYAWCHNFLGWHPKVIPLMSTWWYAMCVPQA